MSTTTAPHRTTAVDLPNRATLRALAVAESKRFARHPLFLIGAAATIFFTVQQPVEHGHFRADVISMPLMPAFFLGVLGFVAAHRLTTSLRRTHEVVATTPVERRQRTAALCLACLVPATVGVIWMIGMLLLAAGWPPVGATPDAPVAWFGDESSLDILLVLVATGPVAALGGPLLGVAVARWAPFRGSALVGMVALIMLVLVTGNSTVAGAVSPWNLFADEKYANSQPVSSTLYHEVTPAWYLLYVICLCGLCVVAALLREKEDRRRLLVIGGALVAVALASAGLSLA
jgi:hypothetical protein